MGSLGIVEGREFLHGVTVCCKIPWMYHSRSHWRAASSPLSVLRISQRSPIVFFRSVALRVAPLVDFLRCARTCVPLANPWCSRKLQKNVHSEIPEPFAMSTGVLDCHAVQGCRQASARCDGVRGLHKHKQAAEPILRVGFPVSRILSSAALLGACSRGEFSRRVAPKVAQAVPTPSQRGATTDV